MLTTSQCGGMPRDDYPESPYWSGLDVCPFVIQGKSGVDDFMVRLNGTMVHAFDGTKTSVSGEIDLKILVGPYELDISFLVDILPVFIYSLGDLDSFSKIQSIKFASEI